MIFFFLLYGLLFPRRWKSIEVYEWTSSARSLLPYFFWASSCARLFFICFVLASRISRFVNIISFRISALLPLRFLQCFGSFEFLFSLSAHLFRVLSFAPLAFLPPSASALELLTVKQLFISGYWSYFLLLFFWLVWAFHAFLVPPFLFFRLASVFFEILELFLPSFLLVLSYFHIFKELCFLYFCLAFNFLPTWRLEEKVRTQKYLFEFIYALFLLFCLYPLGLHGLALFWLLFGLLYLSLFGILCSCERSCLLLSLVRVRTQHSLLTFGWI